MLDIERLTQVQSAVAVGVLALLWLLETWLPLFVDRPRRLLHAGRNLMIGALNLAMMALVFAAAVSAAAAWAEHHRFGLLHRIALPGWAALPLALVLFDAWMYAWHRANHRVPFLWRFHRMHHSDPNVDVTTALRFHAGEIALSSLLRLAVVPLLGIQLWQIVLYETILLPVIAFHHSNVALPERWDRLLRLVIVSPNMHRVHHSDWRPETDSNYSSIFSWWDRLFQTLRLRDDVRTLRYGLREFDGEEWQSPSGLLKTPLANVTRQDN
jgi:sterol desaturase/sphingolipid hydroxylase (fatty acid hydroxylase superfamily)